MLQFNRKTISALVCAVALIGTAVAYVGCGSSSNNSSSPVNYTGSSSPGDVWNFTINRGAGTFSATSDAGQPTNAAAAFTISGSLQVLSSGYLKLTVSTVSSGGPTMTMDGVQNVGYALEVPSVALIVQPAGGGSLITSIVNSGSCNALNGAGFNYVRTGYGSKSTNISTTDAYGSITMNGNSSAPAISAGSSFNSAGGTLTFNNPGVGTCSNGIITFPGNATGIVTQASGGIMVLDAGPGNGGIVVMGGNSLSGTDISGLTFNGLVFKNNSSSIQAIQVVFDGAGAGTTGTVKTFTSVDNNTLGATSNLVKSVSSSGIFNVTATDANGANGSVLHGVIQKAQGSDGVDHIIILLVGADVGATTNPFNVLLVSQ